MKIPSANPIQFMSLATLIGALGAVVLLVLPFTDNFLSHTKTYALFATALIVAMLFLVRVIKRHSFDIVLTPFAAPLALFGGVALLSTFLTNAYPVENLLGMGGVYLAMVVIALLGGSLLPKDSSRTYLSALGVIGSLLVVLTGLQLVGFGPAQWVNNLFGLNIPGGLLFNLTGSVLVALQVALVGLVGIAAVYLKDRKLPTVLMVSAVALLAAVVMFGYALLPGKETSLALPSYTASWSVALDALRYPRSALIGVGPANYTNVYTQFKPAWVNMQNDWGVAYSQAANMPMTVLTTMGFIGLLAWILLAIAGYRLLKKANQENKPLAWMIAAMLLLQLIMPANVVILTLLAITIAVLAAAEKHKLPLLQIQALSARVVNAPKADNDAINYAKNAKLATPFNAIAVLLLIGALFLTYMVGRSYAAHVYMNESNKAALRDDAINTYDLQRQAVALNPYLDTFRRRYAYTNMLIAVALSNRADATDEDAEQVSQLLQQSVREAKAATLLDPADTQNWTALAQIYEQMIGASEEAIQWAIQSYVNAIETNPMDPNLRIALGGIFLGQEDYAQAANIFSGAVDVKPDFANSYYNLGVALENLGRFTDAKSAYQQVLSLIDPESEDYTTVAEQLQGLEGKIEETEEATGSAQTAPSLLEQNLQPQDEIISNPGDLDLEAPETSDEEAQDLELDEELAPEATGAGETDEL